MLSVNVRVLLLLCRLAPLTWSCRPHWTGVHFTLLFTLRRAQVYRPVAQRGSSMYFLIRDLAALNHMYQFSLGTFLMLFKRALDQV